MSEKDKWKIDSSDRIKFTALQVMTQDFPLNFPGPYSHSAGLVIEPNVGRHGGRIAPLPPLNIPRLRLNMI